MAKNSKYLYLHTGDILKVGEKGATLGRKKSRKNQLVVDDDLPGSNFEFGGMARGRQIFTLPHGSRSVGFVSKIEEEHYIEEGEKISFNQSPVKTFDELERGRLIFEKGEYILLKDLTRGTLNRILREAKKTSMKFWELAKPSLAGLCGKQQADAIRYWRRNNKGIRVTTETPNENNNLEDALKHILRTSNPRDYIEPELIHLLEFIILIEFLDNLWNEPSSFSVLKSETLGRFERLFETLRSRHGYPSKIILPLSQGDDIHDIALDLVDSFGLDALRPFIQAKKMGRAFCGIDEWLDVLQTLKEFFPTMSHLSWMETEEGNDVSMNAEMKIAGLGNVVIDFLTIINKHFAEPDVRQLDSRYQNFGIQIRKAATYHHGYRVVCDRVMRNDQERDINAIMELYDNRCRRMNNFPLDIGNDPRITHESSTLDYTDAEWLVLRVGATTAAPDLPEYHFDGKKFENNPDSHLPNNPWEAFVTLPWFIQYDARRSGVGILNSCSDQLIHVHFLYPSHHGPEELLVMIPIKTRKGDSFNIIQYAGPWNSHTTVCFRSMYNISPNEDEENMARNGRNYQNPQDLASPGMKWWIERPSILF
jgi:hypothetical protein